MGRWYLSPDSVVPTSDKSKALLLHWNDYTYTTTAGQVDQYLDHDSGTYYTRDNTQTVKTTLYGASRFYRGDMNALQKEYPDSYVGADGVIYQPTGGAVPVNDVVISATGGTRMLTFKEVEGFSITLSFPNGLYEIQPSKGYVEARVSLSVFYRPYDVSNPPTNATPWRLLVQNWVAAGKQRAELLKTIKHSKTDERLPLSRYEILVVRNTEDHTGNMNFSDDVYIKSITEVVYGSIAYNHTALVGVKIRATDQLSGQVPTITSLVKGIKVQVPSNLVAAYQKRYDASGNYNGASIAAAYTSAWDGQLATKRVWTDNPVWCLYDLLTNTRYGLGNYYKVSPKKHGLMLANFYLMAKYCDEALSYVDDSGATYVTKTRPRFALNIVIDQTKTAAEWVSQIAAVMRATVFYSEGLFWLDIDRPKPVTQLFTMSSITDFTQTGTSFRSIPNSYEVQWINPDLNYEIDSFKLDAKELQADPTLEERKKALQLIGVTNFDHAKTLTKYALYSGQTKDKLVSFKTGTNGLCCSVTDIVGIQHDVPQWGYGGKLSTYDPSTGEAGIYPAIVVQPWHTYTVKVDYGRGEILESSLLVGAQTSSINTLSLATGLDSGRLVGAECLLGAITNTIAKFKVVGIKRDSAELVEVTAVRHEDSMFDAVDDSSDLSPYTIGNYSLLQNPVRSSVQGVFASTKFYQDALGVWKTGVEIFYDVPQGSSFWQAAQIHHAKAGTTEYIAGEINSTGYFFLPYVESGSYMFVVTSHYVNGKQAISEALKDAERHPWTTLDVDNFAPNDTFMEGVTGLGIQNRNNDGTFIGRDCIVVWRRPAVIDATADSSAGTEVAGAGTESADNWLSHYEVEVHSLQDARRRVEKVTTEKFVYTHEMNMQDGVTRAFKVTVCAYDKLGRKSEGKTIECTNPAPAAID